MNIKETPKTNYEVDDLGIKTERNGMFIVSAMSELKTSICDLQIQISEMSKNIRGTMKLSADKISSSVDRFSINIEKYSESSDKYYKAIIWLTAALVLVGVGNIIIAIFK